MALGLLGRKVGMTRIFRDDGDSVPVTVIDASGNRVVQVKTPETDGYTGVQVAFGKRRPIRVNKPTKGHFAKAGVEAGLVLREFRLAEGTQPPVSGSSLSVDMFQVGQLVDVTGTSQGKGFAGTIKRHNFSSQRETHGNSISHRTPGSIGMNQDPGRVFPGKRMAGHMGAARTTAQGLEIVRIDSTRSLLLVRGSVPGSRGGNVIVRPTTKGNG